MTDSGLYLNLACVAEHCTKRAKARVPVDEPAPGVVLIPRYQCKACGSDLISSLESANA